MYKIIFLDDEMMTLKLLEHAVDWQKYKIDLCGSASDGEEGIALFQQVQPDIVITDIRMPRMNGIELAAALRQTTKKAKILLFSAYAEFEYAQSAITYEISEYLLKPLDEDKLEAAIARIVQELDREQALSSTIESYRLEQAERQLQQLFAGGRSGARRDLPVPLPDQIAAACGPVDTLLACVCTAEPHEPELRSDVEVVRLRLKEQLGPMTPIVAISPVELIALAAASRLGPQFATLADTLHSLRSQGCPLVVGVGPLADPPDLAAAHDCAEKALDACFYSGQALCTTLPSGPALAGDRAGAAPLGLVEFEQPIAALVEQGKDRDLNACLQSRLATLLQLHAEPELICSFVFAILNWVKIELTKQHRTGVPGGLESITPARLRACGDAAALAAYLDHRLAAIGAGVTSLLAADPGYHIVRQAKEYTRGHYAEVELSLQDVALHVGLSKNHFSQVFHKVTGQTFWNYVTQLRIEKAKEMLKQGNSSNAEICRAIGYASEYHFSKIFKRVTGVATQQYRKL